jgi:hypothetical protein
LRENGTVTAIPVSEALMRFRYIGLPVAPFAPFFELNDDALIERGMRRMVAQEKPGFPCRVTLEDAEPGELVLLLPYEHQPAHSPYRASGPIFVRENALAQYDRAGEPPPVLHGRTLSLRAYAKDGMMVDADVTEGAEVETVLQRLFARDDTACVHIHNARRGCYACRVERAEQT